MSEQGWIIVLLCGIIGVLSGVLYWVWHSRYDEGVKDGYDDGHMDGLRTGKAVGYQEGKQDAECKERVAVDEYKKQLAKDRAAFEKEKAVWEQDHVMRVAAVPYGVKALRVTSEPLPLDYDGDVSGRLTAMVLDRARNYVELESYEEPMYYGRRYRATLYVARRGDLK